MTNLAVVSTRRICLILTLTAAAALAAWAIAPGPADAQQGSQLRGTFTTSVIAPLPGETERGIAQLTVRRGEPASIIAILIGLTVDPNNPNVTYVMRLSARTCGELARNPARPRYVGSVIDVTFDRDTGTANLDHDEQIGVRAARRARSMVLLSNEDGTFTRQACGGVTTFKLQDVLVSS